MAFVFSSKASFCVDSFSILVVTSCTTGFSLLLLLKNCKLFCNWINSVLISSIFFLSALCSLFKPLESFLIKASWVLNFCAALSFADKEVASHSCTKCCISFFCAGELGCGLRLSHCSACWSIKFSSFFGVVGASVLSSVSTKLFCEASCA